MNWNRIDLMLKTANLVAEDRKAYGRDPGKAGQMRRLFEECCHDFIKGMRTIIGILDAGSLR
jgi:hypothetical protein